MTSTRSRSLQWRPVLQLKPRAYARWLQWVSCLLVLTMFDAYGGGHAFAETARRARRIEEHNARVLQRMGYQAPLTKAEIEKRKVAARALIAKTRAPEIARQKRNLEEVARWKPQLWEKQYKANLAGLSRTIEDITETVRRIERGNRKPQDLLHDGRALYFQRETVRSLARQLYNARQIPAPLHDRFIELAGKLDALGDRAADLDPARIRQAALSVRQLFTSYVAEQETSHRARNRIKARAPHWGGNDLLTGKPLAAPRVPHALEPRTSPRIPPAVRPAELQALYGDVPQARISSERVAAMGAPDAGDLGESLEVQLTDEIRDLAASLDNDPLQIYEYVTNNIDYRIYAGSVNGAQTTLEARAGNDVDQASLLIALLRAADIPARYETGTQIVPVDAVARMTGIQDPGSAATALATLGVSAVRLYDASKLVALQWERTWVRAYIPYSNYRGAPGIRGDGGSPQWVALDPAAKNYQLEQDVDLSKAVSFSVDQFLSASTTMSALDFYEQELRDYVLTTQTKCETLDQAMAKRVNQPQKLPIVSTTPSFELEGAAVSAPELGSAMRYLMTLEATDQWGYSIFTQTLPVTELYGKRLAFTFPGGTGIYSSLSGLVIPTLSLDGQVLARGQAVQTGTPTGLHVTLSGPGAAPMSFDHNLFAGGTYVISHTLGPVPDTFIASAQAEANALKSSGAPQNQQDLAIAEVAGLTYLSRHHTDDNSIYALNGWMHFTAYEAVTGTAIVPESFWGLPTGATAAGYAIDALNFFFAVPLRGQRSETESARIAQIAGYNGSFHEHRVWEQVLSVEALSSANILQLARQDKQTIHFLNSLNDYYAIASQLKHPADVIDDVTDALGRGEQVVISDHAVTRGDKTVSGYVLFDPRTGAGQYLINNGLNGAMTLLVSFFLSLLADLVGLNVNISSQANVATGSLSDDRYEFLFFAEGQFRLITRQYHSEQDLASDLGPGWQWSWGERLFENSSSGEVTRLDTSGVKSVFTHQTDGTYTPPTGTFDVLARTSSGWTLTSKDQQVLTFDGQGRFLKQADRYGNTVILERTTEGLADRLVTPTGVLLVELSTDAEGHITRMKDAAGRTLSLSYTDGRLTGVQDTRGNHWAYAYGSNGRLIGKVEGDGTPIAYSYDGENRLIRYSTPGNGEGFFAYDTVNKASTWTNPVGAERAYRFDQDGRLLEQVDPVGNKTSLEYKNGLVTKITDARAGITSLNYDAEGNVTQSVRPDGSVTALTWDGENRLTSLTDARGTRTIQHDDIAGTRTITDAEGNVEVQTLNSRGQVASRALADGSTLHYGFDAQGEMVSSTDGVGNTTTYGYDAVGRMASSTTPGGEVTALAYDGQDHVEQITLPTGAKISASYTPFGDVQTAVGPTGNTVSFTYQEKWLTSSTDPYGRKSAWERDAAGRVTATVDPLGNRATQTLDAADRVVSKTDNFGNTTENGFCADVGSTPCNEIDPMGNLVQRDFDAVGRPLTETTDLGTTTYEYGCTACAKPTAMIDALGNQTEYSYDSRSNLIEVKDALGGITRYGYDVRNKLTSITDASGAVTTYQRDLAGRIEDIVDSLGRTTSFGYDGNGRMSSKTDPNGNTTVTEYDGLGNISAELFADGYAHSYAFDATGRKTRSTSNDVDLEQRFEDPFGRLSSVINHTLNQRLDYTYDPVTQQRATLARPDGVQTYSYNQFGQIAAIRLPDGQVVKYQYDEFGRLAAKVFPNGTVQKDTYDAHSRLLSRITYNRDGVALVGTSYTYDGLNRRTSATDVNGRKTEYGYDALSRLILEKTQDKETRYVYDAVGNRLEFWENGALKTAYTYDATHRIETSTTGAVVTTYEHDENGNMVAKHGGGQTTTYGYDMANRLTGAVLPGGMIDEFKYDAEGRRSYRSDSQGDANILYDNEDAILELSSSGQLLKGVAHGPGIDEPLALMDYRSTRKTYLYHTDAQGSILALSGSSGSLANVYSYDSFGILKVQQKDTSDDLAYTARRADLDLGTFDYRAREMDPSLGRFLQGDPLTPAALETSQTGTAAIISHQGTLNLSSTLGNAQQLNPYSYVGGNPINFADPSGELTMDEIDNIGKAILAITIVAIVIIALWPFIVGGGTVAAGGAAAVGGGTAIVSLEAEEPLGENIALGLSEYLEEFALQVGGRTWTQWAAQAPNHWKLILLEKANNPLNNISFNLTGIDNVWQAISKCAAGPCGATNWELWQIYSNPAWWSRITFYLNGQVVPNPFGG